MIHPLPLNKSADEHTTTLCDVDSETYVAFIQRDKKQRVFYLISPYHYHDSKIIFDFVLQTDVRWDKEQCTSQQIKFFPETEIPPYFSFNGTVRVGYQLCEQWIWRTGGHNPGQATSVVTYYIANQTNVVRDEDKNTFVPVKVETFFNSGPVNKTTSHMVFNITSFLIGDVDEELLNLPSFCHKEVKVF